MVAALSGLISALAVIFALSSTTTRSEPIDSLLNIISSWLDGRTLRILTADEAASGLFYAVIVFMIAYAASYFLLRVIAIFLAAIGIPDEENLRVNRDLRRNRGTTMAYIRRLARYQAVYSIRAQQAFVAAQRRRQARAAASRNVSTSPANRPPAPEPTLDDFNL